MISAKNMARLNNRNLMTDEERRADIMAETFGLEATHGCD